MKTQTVPAYAKLNLTLDILGKRPDGYHELRMVMQTVSLCDDVTVTLTDGTGVACRVAGAELPCDERNLAVKAANAFCEALGYHGGIDIALTKRIPSEAGMAGGSADAAAVLRALHDLIAPTLTDERLEEIGALNDGDYAAMLARHYSGAGYGEAKIRDELYRRGVPRELWEDALSALPEAQETIMRVIAQKTKGRALDEKGRKRLSDMLLRRGFAWRDVRAALARFCENAAEFDYEE